MTSPMLIEACYDPKGRYIIGLVCGKEIAFSMGIEMNSRYVRLIDQNTGFEVEVSIDSIVFIHREQPNPVTEI